jgi:hypothetical protein
MITVHVDRSEIFSLSVEMQRSMQVPGITLRLAIEHRQHALPIIVSHIGQSPHIVRRSLNFPGNTFALCGMLAATASRE